MCTAAWRRPHGGTRTVNRTTATSGGRACSGRSDCGSDREREQMAASGHVNGRGVGGGVGGRAAWIGPAHVSPRDGGDESLCRSHVGDDGRRARVGVHHVVDPRNDIRIAVHPLYHSYYLGTTSCPP